MAGIAIEAILTLFLVWAVYGTAVSPLAPRIAGFGIGLTVMTDILVGGPLTGAAIAGVSIRYLFAPPPDRTPV